MRHYGTFLAWLRTALGLLAAAVAVVQLVPELVIPGARLAIGGVLALLSVFTAGSGMHRWEQVNKAMRLGLPLPRQRTPLWLGAGFILVALLGLIVIANKVIQR